MAKELSERVAVNETEITHLKATVKRVCENDLPHIYNKLDQITKFCDRIVPVVDDVKEIKGTVSKIKNQEKLGRKEKAAIITSAIISAASVLVALIGIL